MVAASYRVEQLAAFGVCLVLILAYLAQALVYRFTPRRKWIETKWQMLVLGVVALAIQTIRAYDLSSVYGVYSVGDQHGIHAQVTALMIDALVVMLLSTARSLYAQINRKIPAYHFWLLWVPAIVYHLASAAFGVWEAVLWHQHRTDTPVDIHALGAVNVARAWTFNAVGVYVLVINDGLFYALYQRVATFVRQLEATDYGRKATAATPAARRFAAAGGTSRGASVSSAPPAAGGSGELKITIQPVSVAPKPYAIQEEALDQSSPPSPVPSPSLLPVSADDGQLLISQNGSGWASSSSSVVAGGGGSGGALTSSDSVDLEVDLSGQVTPVSGRRDGHRMAAAARPHRATVTPSSRRSSGGPALASPSRSQVHPLASYGSGDATPPVGSPKSPHAASVSIMRTSSFINSSIPTAASATAATAVTAGVAASSSPSVVDGGSGERVSVLRMALRKMLCMLVFVNVVMAASIAADLPGCVSYIQGTMALADVAAADPDAFTLVYNLTYWLQMAAVAILLWYAWTDCTVWTSRTVRAEKNTPFWRTLRHGLASEGTGPASRYAAPNERRVMEQSTHAREPPSTLAQPTTTAATPSVGPIGVKAAW